MKEITGNIWDYYEKGFHVAITTNGFVKRDGRAVMGAGVAKQAVFRIPDINLVVGTFITNFGSHVMYSSVYKLLTFPVKHKWFEDADLDLIEQSAIELVKVMKINKIANVFMPRPGCGNGRLKWYDVRPLLADKFDDRITIVEVNP